MAFLTGITQVLDSTGTRVDSPQADGSYLPVKLKLDATLSAVAAVDGPNTVITLSSVSGVTFAAVKAALAVADSAVDFNGFGLTGLASLAFETTAPPVVGQAALAGTGANVGAATTLFAQPGQSQSGGAANNKGGAMQIYSGVAGTGGGGAAAVAGDLILGLGAANSITIVEDAATFPIPTIHMKTEKSVAIRPVQAAAATSGAFVVLRGGDAGATGARSVGGTIDMKGGAAAGNSGAGAKGGGVSIEGGAGVTGAGDGDGGDVVVKAGARSGAGATHGSVQLVASDGSVHIKLNATGLGFFATAPIAKPTGVAVSAAGIHAALVSLGLIAA